MASSLQAALARIRAALMRRGRTEHDADDLVQEAWIRLARYERKESVDEPEAFLMRTALNLSIDAYRAQLVRGEAVLVEDVVLLDTAPSIEAAVLAKERMVRLSQCLSRLNEKTRAIFLSYRVDGMTYQEIATQYGLATSTVEKHVARATLLVTTWMEGW